MVEFKGKAFDKEMTLREFLNIQNNLIPEIKHCIDNGEWTEKEKEFLMKELESDDLNQAIWEYLTANEVIKDAIQDFLDSNFEENEEDEGRGE